MTINHKQSSQKLASQAAKVMRSNNASEIQKSLAASVVSQANSNKQTSAKMEVIASNVLRSNKYSTETKAYAASVLAQSNKERGCVKK